MCAPSAKSAVLRRGRQKPLCEPAALCSGQQPPQQAVQRNQTASEEREPRTMIVSCCCVWCIDLTQHYVSHLGRCPARQVLTGLRPLACKSTQLRIAVMRICDVLGMSSHAGPEISTPPPHKLRRHLYIHPPHPRTHVDRVTCRPSPCRAPSWASVSLALPPGEPSLLPQDSVCSL